MADFPTGSWIIFTMSDNKPRGTRSGFYDANRDTSAQGASFYWGSCPRCVGNDSSSGSKSLPQHFFFARTPAEQRQRSRCFRSAGDFHCDRHRASIFDGKA
jgi:hypothetical protein